MLKEKVINIKIPGDLHKTVKITCIETNQSIRELIIKALSQYVKSIKQDASDQGEDEKIEIENVSYEELSDEEKKIIDIAEEEISKGEYTDIDTFLEETKEDEN